MQTFRITLPIEGSPGFQLVIKKTRLLFVNLAKNMNIKSMGIIEETHHEIYRTREDLPFKLESNHELMTFYDPSNIFITTERDIFIADTTRNRIVKITREGDVVLIDGKIDSSYSLNESIELSSPQGVFVSDRIYIADTGNGRIVSIDIVSCRAKTILSSSDIELIEPRRVSVDDSGRLIVTSLNSIVILPRKSKPFSIPIPDKEHSNASYISGNGEYYYISDQRLMKIDNTHSNNPPQRYILQSWNRNDTFLCGEFSPCQYKNTNDQWRIRSITTPIESKTDTIRPTKKKKIDTELLTKDCEMDDREISFAEGLCVFVDENENMKITDGINQKNLTMRDYIPRNVMIKKFERDTKENGLTYSNIILKKWCPSLYHFVTKSENISILSEKQKKQLQDIIDSVLYSKTNLPTSIDCVVNWLLIISYTDLKRELITKRFIELFKRNIESNLVALDHLVCMNKKIKVFNPFMQSVYDYCLSQSAQLLKTSIEYGQRNRVKKNLKEIALFLARETIHSIHFKDGEFSLKRSFRSLFNNKEDSDITIRIGENSYYCHKTILASFCPFFVSVHDSVREYNADLTLFPASHHKAMLHYCYDKHNAIKRLGNVQSLIECSMYYQIKPLTNWLTSRALIYRSPHENSIIYRKGLVMLDNVLSNHLDEKTLNSLKKPLKKMKESIQPIIRPLREKECSNKAKEKGPEIVEPLKENILESKPINFRKRKIID